MKFFEYFVEVKKYPQLNAWKVKIICKSVATVDVVKELTTRNLQLVCRLVLSYLGNCKRYGIDPMDLVGAGNVGLLMGTLKYLTSDKNISYFLCVTGYIKSYIKNEFYRHTIYSRAEGQKLICIYKNARVLAQLSGIPLPECANLNPIISLNSIVEESEENEDDNLTLEDVLAHPCDRKVETLTEMNDLLIFLKKANGSVHPKSEEIMELRYAVGSRRYFEPLSLSKAAEVINLSREGVRKIEKKTLAFLREKIGE